ncbi:MAG: DUF4139 domain-containing protein [Candidatus Competibacteraceae bacterium]|nr:DUF4139 domain-containing protein [Candidatus Competibacteraceae bacterium]
MMNKTITGLCLSLLLMANVVHARNVDLSTVPDRQAVQLTIYNSEDLTLVRETRIVTFKQGINPLQFSWANTLIDPTSVDLQFPGQADGLEVLDTTFPHDKPQMLYWNVHSYADREAKIQIEYFTSGISWSADYLAIADREEQNLQLESFVRVRNDSGEDYENAQVRLVVGTINLVEKIAELARIPVSRVNELEKEEYRRLRQQAGKRMMAFDAVSNEALLSAPAPAAEAMAQPKQIVKEGLSEYFIYTIEGTETVPNGWSKRLRSFEADAVPFKVQYRYRVREYGNQLVRLYLLTNDIESGLGTTPLPDGQVRIFRDNGRDGLSYLAAQTIKYVPIGDKIELNLGTDPEVIFELVKLKTFRDNLWMRVKGGNIYRQVGSINARVEINSQVAGWDEHQVFSQRVRNYTGKPIAVEIRREYPGDTVFRSQLNPKLHDFRTVEFSATLEPGEKADLHHEIVEKHGYNKKQDRVTLEKGAVRL